MGMGITRLVYWEQEWEWEWEWEWVDGNGWKSKTPHYPIYHSQVADHQTLLMDPSFCIVICRRLQTAMLDFTLHVHDTLLAQTLHVQAYFEDLSVVCIVEFKLLAICCLIEMLLAVREWERE